MPSKQHNNRHKQAPTQSTTSTTISTSTPVPLHKTEQSNPANTLRTVFARDPPDVIEHNKALTRQPITPHPPPHISIDYYAHSDITIPHRPTWTPDMSKHQLDSNEHAAFDKWLHSIYAKYDATQLNHFEHNLEVWRQLWRVCERSDVLVVIADCRNPLFNIPPALYEYITQTQRKPMVLVLNKVDYVPSECVDEWIQYMSDMYALLRVVPYTSKASEVYTDEQTRLKQTLRKKAGGALRLEKPVGADALLAALREVVAKQQQAGGSDHKLAEDAVEKFSFDTTLIDEKLKTVVDRTAQHIQNTDGSSNDDDDDATRAQKHAGIPLLGPSSRKARAQDSDADDDQTSRQRRKRGGKKNKGRAASKQRAQEASDDNSDDGSDVLPAGKQRSKGKQRHSDDNSESDADDVGDVSGVVQTLHDDDDRLHNSTDGQQATPFISIGFIGYPNSGKSSVINSLCGRKLVSVSSTPGHTKHLQSIYLNQFTCLLDSPGLVFPCVHMPRAVQVLAGCYPIAQTRDPCTAVRYLGERVDLVRLYKLVKDKDLHDYDDFSWSAWTICEAYAGKHGYRSKKGVLDVYRAANAILRDQLQGKILLYYWPPTHTASSTSNGQA